MTYADWIIQGPGWALVLYLLVTQCTSAISYGFGVRYGFQEPESRITAIGTALFWGFALADLVFYAPLLALALVADLLNWAASDALLGAALGVTVYWPIVCLATVKRARGVENWHLPKEGQYWLALPAIILWGLVSLLLILAGLT